LLKVACSGSGVSRTRNLSVTGPILYHYTTAPAVVQRGGDWAGPQLAQALLTVPNVTAHPSTASVPITLLLYNGPLLCGFNVLKGLKHLSSIIVSNIFSCVIKITI